MHLLPLGLTVLLLATNNFLMVMTDVNGSLTATSIVFINGYVYSQHTTVEGAVTNQRVTFIAQMKTSMINSFDNISINR
jgi:hypothetical protein